MSARLHRGSRPFRRALLRNTAIMVSVLSVGVLLPPLTARGDIYVVNYGTNTIGKYSNSGGVVNASLISGLHQPQGIAVSGSNLFVTNEHASPSTGEPGGVGEYTTSGGVVNTSLVTNRNWPVGIAVSGSNLFVTNVYNPASDAIDEYTTSGVAVSIPLLSGPAFPGPDGIAVSGSNLFVANYGGTIGEYTTSGGIVNASLVSGLSEPEGLVLSGPDLFVANFGNGTIGEYTTSGVVVNASLISGLNGPVGIVVTPAPEPSTLALLGASVLGLLAYAWRRRRVLNPAELCWTVGCRA